MRIQQFFIYLLLLTAVSCTTNKPLDFQPASHWSAAEQDSIKLLILPHFAKLPKGATHQTKFNPEFDAYYRALMRTTDWMFVAPDGNDGYYFMINRVAPSLYEKKIAIAGKLKLDENRSRLEAYEEAFWTFKMKKDDLFRKGKVLFEAYVAGEDLSSYYPMNMEEEWIEFPDQHNVYNKSAQKWDFIHEQ